MGRKTKYRDDFPQRVREMAEREMIEGDNLQETTY